MKFRLQLVFESADDLSSSTTISFQVEFVKSSRYSLGTYGNHTIGERSSPSLESNGKLSIAARGRTRYMCTDRTYLIRRYRKNRLDFIKKKKGGGEKRKWSSWKTRHSRLVRDEEGRRFELNRIETCMHNATCVVNSCLGKVAGVTLTRLFNSTKCSADVIQVLMVGTFQSC